MKRARASRVLGIMPLDLICFSLRFNNVLYAYRSFCSGSRGWIEIFLNTLPYNFMGVKRCKSPLLASRGFPQNVLKDLDMQEIFAVSECQVFEPRT